MQFNYETAAIITASAVFFSFVGCLIGAARSDRKHNDMAGHRRTAFENHMAKLRVTHEEKLEAVQTQHETTLNLLAANYEKKLTAADGLTEDMRQKVIEATTERDQVTINWKYADRYRAAIVETMMRWGLWDFNSHKDDPIAMITMIGNEAARQGAKVIDEANEKKLISRGVRKANKANKIKLVYQAERLQLAYEGELADQAQKHAEEMATVKATLAAATRRNVYHNLYVGRLVETVNAKLKLPGVREAFYRELNARVETIDIGEE